MDFNGYQEAAKETAIYPGNKTILGLSYVALGLGEAGEVQGKVKKIIRDDDGVLTEPRRQELIAEAGDVLWYLALLAEELDVTLEEIAQINIAKLLGRALRDTIKGSGDKR